MLLEPERTQFDLHFRMLGVDVRVHPMFWLMSALFGLDTLREGVPYLVFWVICVFVSILLHELGHVFIGRVFGSYGHIVLFSFGGLAIGSSDLRSRWQRIAVYFAGPLAQFILYGLIWGFLYLDGSWLMLGKLPKPVLAGVAYLLFINLYWPLLNLLPVWPLDGGRISREILEWLMPAKGIRVSLGLSVLVAGLLAVNSLVAAARPDQAPLIPFLYAGGMYTALFFGLLALSSFQAMQAEERKPWERDPDHWGH
jgi:stage IV sporulation protein FB